MFQVDIFFRILSYFKLLISLVLPFFPGDDDEPSDKTDEVFNR